MRLRRSKRAAEDGSEVVDVYWRPGCPYCFRLRWILRLERIPGRWHNIWTDRTAAAFVRWVAGGDETVPTVVVAGQPYVNPDPARVVELARHISATRRDAR